MSEQKYLDVLKVLENELLSYRWGCVCDFQNKKPLAEFGNLPNNANGSFVERCVGMFDEALKTDSGMVEFVAQDDQWMLLMRRFAHGSLLCFIILRSGGVTTGWARDTFKQKIEEFSLT